MAEEIRLPPSAAALSASMRDIGYSLETAIADLVDNSISAGATEVRTYCVAGVGAPALAIVDNGEGMTAEEIIAAIRHGGNARKTPRSPHDLGKFGLGLKTASFSQCRRLTVVSRKHGQVRAAEWNLDTIAQRDAWIVSVLDGADIARLPHMESLPPRGTLVLWRNLDRLTEGAKGPRQHTLLNAKIAAVERHLGLVFHRFLSGEVPWHRKLRIWVNGHGARAFDPFHRAHPATQWLPHERIPVDGHQVDLRAYILPHYSKLSAHENDLYQSRGDFVNDQGVYVYRNCRLIDWGGWFRLAPRSEATKLARVQIDFPSALDRYWVIDVKKSRANPPGTVRTSLKQILARITEKSVKVHEGRGQRLQAQSTCPIWNRVADPSGIRYELNISHPVADKVRNRLGEEGQAPFRLLLRAIASSLPVEMIYADQAAKPGKPEPKDATSLGTMNRLKLLQECLPEHKRFDKATFCDLARSTQLFEHCWRDVERFVGGWSP